jgi:hypothetical protein
MFLLRHRNQEENIPYFLQYYSLPSIPYSLKKIFNSYLPNDTWFYIDPAPPILHGPIQFVVFPASRQPSTSSSAHQHEIPTFLYQPPKTPNARIREDSVIQITYMKDGKIMFIPSLQVLGSRGMTTDFHHEILELQRIDIPSSDRDYTVYLHVPPSFLHPEIAMITEMNAPNFKFHQRLLAEWNFLERHFIAKLSDELKNQRSMLVWRLFYRYLEARREQHI